MRLFTYILMSASLLLAGCQDFSSALGGDGTVTTNCSPTVLSVTPYTLPPSGGASFTVAGTCFASGMKIYFQGQQAVTFTVDSDTTAHGTSPASSAYGSATVAVINPDKTSSTLSNGVYFQGPPSITTVTPNSGAIAGGTSINLVGQGFVAGATIQFGTSGTPVSLSVLNAAQASVTVPPGASGAVDLIVKNPDGQATTFPGGYTYQPAPSITGISPGSGPSIGGSLVNIFGANFRNNATITFGGASCTNISISSSGLQITCTTPPSLPGAVDVKVSNSDNQSATLPGGYTFTGSAAQPNVLSISPSSGSSAGSTSVTISGSAFQTGATVSIGGASVSVTSLTSTTITGVTSSHAAGVVSVTVTNPDTQSGTLGSAYTYNDPPVVTGVSPTAGPLGGGNTLTLTGSGFSALATIKVGTGTCSSVFVNAPGTVATCTAPAQAAGTKSIVVTNPDGTIGNLPNSYTYNPAPTITSISPNAGKLASGTMATITGTNFITGAGVTVGGAGATVTSGSATSLLVTLPAGTAGVANVIVTNPDGQAATLVGGYTYEGGPSVSSVSPGTGAVGGGTAVTITGNGFISPVTVDFGGSALSGATVASPTSITGFTTSHLAGAVTVTVTNPDNQTGNKPNAFTYAAGPTVTSSSPNAGALAGGTTVTVTGTGFAAPMTVKVNGNSGTAVNVTSSTQLSFVTPANAAGTYGIVVTDSFSQSATLSNAFTYNPAPTISSISPVAGPLAGGTSVTINGSGFLSGATISIGGANLTGVSIGSTSITGTTAANSAGSYSAVVSNSDGQSVSGGSFAYRAAPTVTAISPTGGTTAGGTSVTITGTNFFTGATVTIGGSTCTGPTVTSTSITCTTPFHPAGATTVIVTNTPDNQASTGGTNLYTYRSPPSVASVSPTIGFVGGGNSITISGSGFSSSPSVTIGATACTNINFVSSSSITCTTPAGTAGIVGVTVTNTDTQTSTLSNSFTYSTDNFTQVDQYLGNVAPNGFLDGTGGGARFNTPSGVATDGAGNVYTAEAANCVIRKVTAAGVVTTIAGIAGSCSMTDGPGSSARFRTPTGIVLDATGSFLYVLEWGAIRKVSTSSPYTVSTLAGSGTAQGSTDAPAGPGSTARFTNPQSLAMDLVGGDTLYVADSGVHIIRKVTISTGAVVTIAGLAATTGTADNATGTSARFNRPSGIAIVGSLLYITDLSNQTLRTVSMTAPYGTATVAGTAGSATGTDGTGAAARFYNPWCVYYDGTYLWIGDGNNSSIRQVTVPGMVVTTLYGTFNSQGSSDDVYNSARFNEPYQITGDATYMYVADYNNHTIRRIKNSNGTVDTLAGVPNSYGYADGAQSVAKFNIPRGISIVGGSIYVGEWNNCSVRATDLASVTTGTFAGQVGSCSALDGNGTFSARFNRIGAMTTDGTNLFVLDTNSHTLRKVVVSSASVTTLAGLNGTSGNATGTGTAARFNTPYGIAIIGTTIYIADSSNHAIRAVSSTGSSTNGGVVTTYAGIAGSAGYLDGALTSAQFNNPRGLVAMMSGGHQHLYVSDYSNCVIRDIDVTSSTVSTLVGTQGSCSFADGNGSLARFNGPWGISTDGTHLFVSDYNNHSVREINGTAVTTVFGSATSSYDPGSNPIGSANVRFPTQILWNNAGLFVVNDYGIKRVH